MENTTEKKYTQEEVDAITEKVKLNQQSKIERNYVSKEDFASLETKYNDLLRETKSIGIKNVFMNLGGLEQSFNDVLTLNSNLLNINDVEELNEEISKIKENKPYFFVQEVSENSNSMINDGVIIKSLTQDETSDRIEGTIYKKNPVR